MKRLLVIVGYGLGGILLALALSLGAFALAGRQLGGPTEPVAPAVNLSDSPTPSWEPSFEPTQTRSPKPDSSPTQAPPVQTPAPSEGGSGSSSPGGESGETNSGDDGHGRNDD
jgi:hypothetical protein